jgi:hypothetical protein
MSKEVIFAVSFIIVGIFAIIAHKNKWKITEFF